MRHSPFSPIIVGVFVAIGVTFNGCSEGVDQVRYVPGCAGLVAVEEHSGVTSFVELRLCREQTSTVYVPDEGRMVEHAQKAKPDHVFVSADFGWESDSPDGISQHLGRYGISGELDAYRLIRAEVT